MSSQKFSKILLPLVFAGLVGCLNESPDAVPDPVPPPPPPAPLPPVPVGGAGVKGPLAGAVVNLYQVNPAQMNLKGALLATGSTGANAAIQGLQAPGNLSGLVLVEFLVDGDTTDLTTGVAPIFDSLVTVVNASRIISGESVYASPLTSMAVSIARSNADSGAPYAGNSDGTVSVAELTAALQVAQSVVKSSLGFGLGAETDIFTASPLITNATTTPAQQAAVVAYRQAIEAASAVIAAVAAAGGGDTPQAAMDALIEDLGDGVINGQVRAEPIAALSTLVSTLEGIVTQDPAALVIPGTDLTIAQIQAVLAQEVATTGATADVSDLADNQLEVPLDPGQAGPFGAIWGQFEWDGAVWQ